MSRFPGTLEGAVDPVMDLKIFPPEDQKVGYYGHRHWNPDSGIYRHELGLGTGMYIQVFIDTCESAISHFILN